MRRLRSAFALIATLAVFPAPTPAQELQGALETRIVEVAERVKPSVVHIEAIVKFNDRRNQVTGSGVIVSTDGRILTNEHVVDKAEKVTVTVPGFKKKWPARIIGADRQTDIALLRITSDVPLPAALLGTGNAVRVGQWVLAIGNPYGLEGTVSLGIVSAKGRNLEIPDLLNDFIQTDAMIDRGSSGGPLVDLEGRVVGINSRGQGRGIGFTIPIETAVEVMAQLEAGGIERGYLGVTIQPLDRELADYLGMPDATGVVVNSVVPDSPADGAGLRAGDVITHFNGAPIEAEKEEDLGGFQRLVASVAPGEKVALATVRGDKERTRKATIGSQPSLDAAEVESDFGFHVQEITENLARDQRLSSTEGAFVFFVARGSPAREAGLQVGDVIERIEGTDVEDLGDFRNAIAKVADKRRFLITARRGDEHRYVLIKPGARALEPDASDDGRVGFGD